MPDSNCAQSEPNACADMQSTSPRERSSPSSIFAVFDWFFSMLSPGLSTHSSNHPFTPSARNRSASGRTTALSFALWLRKMSYGKSSGITSNGDWNG